MANETPVSSATTNFASILGALQAVKNVRAVVLTALVLVVCAVLAGLVSYVGGRIGIAALIVAGMLFTMLVGIYGLSAVGFMLMNDARGAPKLSIVEALTVSLMSTHRWIVVMLLALVVFILFAIVLALILFVCKIPFAGPVLYTVVAPVAIFVTAFFIASMYFVVIPLAFPSVWSGDGAMQVVSKLVAIARQRLVPVIVQVVLLMILVSFVGGIIGGVVFVAMGIVGALSAAILDVGGGLAGLASMSGMGGMRGMGRMAGSASTGYMIAASIGYGIVFAVVLIVPFLMMFQGYCLIYLDTIKGMDFSAADAELKAKMDEIQRKAREAQERAREKTQAQPAPQPQVPQPQAPQPMPQAAPVPQPQPIAPPPPPPPAPPPPAPAPVMPAPAPMPAAAATQAVNCPKCNFAITHDDMFCGGCGHKLR